MNTSDWKYKILKNKTLTYEEQKEIIKNIKASSHWKDIIDWISVLDEINSMGIKIEDNLLLDLVQNNNEYLSYLKRIPKCLVEKIFIKEESFLDPWGQKSAIQIIVDARKAKHKTVDVSEKEYEMYLHEYLRKAPWSLEILSLTSFSDVDVLKHAIIALNSKFSMKSIFKYSKSIRNGIPVIETMTEKKFIKYRSKDIFTFMFAFSSIFDIDAIKEFILLFPYTMNVILKSTSYSHKLIRENFHKIIKDNDFMKKVIDNNKDYFLIKRNLTFLLNVGIDAEIANYIDNMAKERKKNKIFKF